MYERLEFMKNAGKAKIENLVLPDEMANHNINTSRGSKDKILRRASKQLLRENESGILNKVSNLENCSFKKPEYPNVKAVSR